MKYIENQLQANMVKVEDTNNNFVSDTSFSVISYDINNRFFHTYIPHYFTI